MKQSVGVVGVRLITFYVPHDSGSLWTYHLENKQNCVKNRSNKAITGVIKEIELRTTPNVVFLKYKKIQLKNNIYLYSYVNMVSSDTVSCHHKPFQRSYGDTAEITGRQYNLLLYVIAAENILWCMPERLLSYDRHFLWYPWDINCLC